jgi:putative hydroxymethylpyrimidine transport system substrate-binding protein
MKRLLATAIVLGLCCATVVGAAAGGSASRTDSPKLTKITVVAEWLLWAAHAPVIAAIDNGYYKQLGLDVRYIAPPNPGDQVKFVVGGQAQIALTQEPDIILSVGKGIPVKMVGELWNQNPTGLLVNPASGIKSVKDFPGHTFGVTNTPDATGPFATLLSRAGIPASKVKIVNPGYGGIPLLLKHRIDALHAVAGGEPSVVRVATHQNWPFIRYTDYGTPNFPLLVWFSSNSYIKSHPDVVRAFIKGTEMGLKAIQSSPAAFKAAMDVIKKSNHEFTPAQHDASALDSRPYWASNPAISPSVLQQTINWMTTVKTQEGTWLPSNEKKPLSDYYTNAYTH